MVKAFRAAFQHFNRLVDWFVPDEIAADRTMRKQTQMFLVSHLAGPFIGNSVPATLYAFDPHPGYQIAVLASSITAFWIFPFLLKYFQHYNALAILSIQNLMFCIIWSCLMLGGIQSPTVPWVLTIPLLSFFYLGSSPDIRLLVVAMFMANFGAFWVLSNSGSIEPSHIPFVALESLGVVSTIAAALYVAMMALFYAKALASQGELEIEMRAHVTNALDLRRAAAIADRTGARKTEFLARISGELRVPLHAVIGYSSILIEGADELSEDGAVAELKVIRESGLELLRLVNDILDLSKIETGRMEIFSEVFNPADLLRDIVAEMQPLAAANGNRLSLRIDESIGAISSDMRKVRIILTQLISNAIKFTRDGSVALDAHTETAGGSTVRNLVLTVSDTGVGIGVAQMPNLFEQFGLDDDVSASKYGGSGLGLALSRKLSRLLGGDITVETRQGRGSRFMITLPVGSPGEDLAKHGAPGIEPAPSFATSLERRIRRVRGVMQDVA